MATAKCALCDYKVNAGAVDLMHIHLRNNHPLEFALLITSKFTLTELDASKVGVEENLFWASQGSRGSYNKIKAENEASKESQPTTETKP